MNVNIYTDGACSGNPGNGGWCAILMCKNEKNNELYKKVLSGNEKNTTNNKMELTAVIEGLKALTKKCDVDLFTDSKYVMEGAMQWLPKWLENGWKSSNKKPVKNQDLWLKLHTLLQMQNITWHWVKGHADNQYNNEADMIARKSCQMLS